MKSLKGRLKKIRKGRSGRANTSSTPAGPASSSSVTSSVSVSVSASSQIVGEPSQPRTQFTKQSHKVDQNHPTPEPDHPPRRLASQLWTQAYDEIKSDDEKLVNEYETIILHTLFHDGSAPQDEGAGDCQLDVSQDRARMVQAVEAGLQKTEQEAAVKRQVQEGIRIVTSVKDFVGKALKNAPEAAAAWGGVCLLLQVLENPINEASSNRSGISYVISRMDWYWELSNLLDKPHGTQIPLQGELKKHIVSLYKAFLTYQMKSICSYFRHRIIGFLRDVIKLDDWEGTIKSIKDAEQVVQQDIDKYSSEDMRQSLRNIASLANTLCASLEGLYAKQETWRQDDKDDKCISDLRLTDPRLDKQRIEDTKGGLFPDASSWILGHEDFLKWKDGDGSLLWIKGDPGKGKTMLLMTIVNELDALSKASDTTALAYFFCQGTDEKLNSATAIVRGLVYMLACECPDLRPHVRKDYDRAGRGLFEDSNAFYALSSILEHMLGDPSLGRVLIAVDALDECIVDQDRLLKLIVRTTTSRARWVVSSRNKDEIHRDLRGIAGTKLSLEIKGNAEQVAEAVNSFIDYKISKLPALQGDEVKMNMVRDVMRRKADGTFLWVALVAEELSRAKRRHVQKVLEGIPSGLNGLYDRMISQIEPPAGNEWDDCQPVLATVVLARRPLTLAELGILSELPLEDVRDVVDSCGSFLTVKDGCVYAIHQSVKDYLISKVSVFPDGQEAVHHAFYSRSIQALLSCPLRRNIYAIPQLGQLIDDVETPTPDPLAAVRYCCVHWINHLCEAFSKDSNSKHGHNLGDDGPVFRFLESHFLHWLEASSLIRAMPEAILSIKSLKNLLMGQSPQSKLSHFINDAYRFIRHNRWVIENAPLQTYTSALLFSPTQSLVRDMFKQEEPSWVSTKPILESTWSPCLQTLGGHVDLVTSVAFSHDSKLVASASYDHTVKIWDVETAIYCHTLKGHNEPVTSVAFSHDSKLVASASRDHTVKIWDVETGIYCHTLKGHSKPVTSVAFSHDSKLVASASLDHTVKIWDVETGICYQALKGHSNWVTSVAFSHDSKLVASASCDYTVKIWDVETGSIHYSLEGHSDWVTSVAFSHNSKLVASASYDWTVKIWDVETSSIHQTGGVYHNLEHSHSHSVTAVAFSHDSKLVASGSDDGIVKIWDVETGSIHQIGGIYHNLEHSHSDSVTAVAFSHDSKLVASGSDDGIVKVWDVKTGSLCTLKGHDYWVSSVAFSHDSKLVASASYECTVEIWDVETGNICHNLHLSDPVTSVAFSDDSSHLITNIGSTRLNNDPNPFTSTPTHHGSFQTLQAQTQARIPETHCEGYGLVSESLFGEWISWNGSPVLWLPLDYRPVCSAVSGLKMVIGCDSGRLRFWEFSGAPTPT